MLGAVHSLEHALPEEEPLRHGHGKHGSFGGSHGLPALQVHVDEWRSGLWQQALQAQDIHDADMAKALQERFRASRLERFVMDHGVRVKLRAFGVFH